MTRHPLIAGVELGGTKVACLLARGPDDILAQTRIDTGNPDTTLAAVSDQLTAWKATHGLDAIGVASFGPIDIDPGSATYGSAIGTPKPGWDGIDLLAPLKALGLPIGFDTDVNGAALAEGRWGAAQALSDFAYVTVGTGIGVGAVVAGRTVRGLGHMEAGHLRSPRLSGHEGFAGVCPYHGDCAEGLAAGPAIAARAGRPAETLTPDHPAWDEPVHVLAALCHNLIYTLAPQRILIGGGVGMGQPHLLPRIRRALSESLGGYAQARLIDGQMDQRILHPGLGDRAGPLGAVAVGLDALAAVSRSG